MEAMAANDRRTNRSVESDMYAAGYRYEFYQAARLFEVLRISTANPIGEDIDPALEAVRFRSSVGLEFPPTDLADIRPVNEGERRAEIVANFMGLAGHFGPLPPTYTELIIERSRKKDHTMREFLDIFNHRLISIFYRLRKRHRVAFDFKPPEKSHFARYLFSLIGLGMDELRGRLGMSDRFLLGFAGIMAQKPRSVVGLQTVLSNFFGLKVEVRSFCGKWYALEESQITKIGTNGVNNALGKTAIVGSKVWDQHADIEICFSELTYEQFQSLLPTGNMYLRLASLAEFYAGREVGFKISLALDSRYAPQLVLDGKSRLGWTSRLASASSDGQQLRMTSSPHQFIAVMKNVAGPKDAEFADAAASFPASLLDTE
ncbi:MAG: type VI secretion system baseplate subunit TssG [Bacteroidetes bacterium]|nr:type VI secretion system baseplate subunit TssG [Bacteroidota bacterium]